MTFSFIDIERGAVEPPPPTCSVVFFFFSQFKYNYSHVCEFLKTEKLHDISLSLYSVCWRSAVNFVSFLSCSIIAKVLSLKMTFRYR